MRNHIGDSSKGVIFAIAKRMIRGICLWMAELGIPYTEIEKNLQLKDQSGGTVADIIKKWK